MTTESIFLLKSRLRIMMFLQFFIWGAWYATLGNYMKSEGMSDIIYLAYMASPLGSIIAPFFLGMVADRFFSVEKVLAVLHLLGGVCIFFAPFFATGENSSRVVFSALLFLNMLCYMPTIGLATTMAFHTLKDKEKEFPLIRVFGTIGWIFAGILVSYILSADTTGLPLHIAGLAGILMGMYSFTLPNVQPLANEKKLSFQDVVGKGTLQKLNSRPVIILLITVLLISIPLSTYYAYVPVFTRDVGISDPAFKMTFGNVSEALFLLLMPWFLLKSNLKWIMAIGMFAWIIRFSAFALGASHYSMWMVMLGILLHGVCYDFVYIAGQIYLDKMTTPGIRARAQGLFVIVSYGIGQGLGTLGAGWLYNKTIIDEDIILFGKWQDFWVIPLLFTILVVVVFLLGGSPSKKKLTFG